MRYDRPVTLTRDPIAHHIERLIFGFHIVGTCVQQNAGLADPRHMTFPEQKITRLWL